MDSYVSKCEKVSTKIKTCMMVKLPVILMIWIYFCVPKVNVFELVPLAQHYGPLEHSEIEKFVAKLVMKLLNFLLFLFVGHASPSMEQDFLINYRMVHSYLCAGM